jgi:hypothetical protein
VWSCYMRSPCGQGREAVLTGWSAEAPPVALPKGVSYSVGAGTGIRHVVLQVMITLKVAEMQVELKSGAKFRLACHSTPQHIIRRPPGCHHNEHAPLLRRSAIRS